MRMNQKDTPAGKTGHRRLLLALALCAAGAMPLTPALAAEGEAPLPDDAGKIA